MGQRGDREARVTRTECGACGSADLEQFLDLGKTPLANTFPASADAEEDFYPLGLCRCPNCGLVQQTEVVPDEVIYGADYGFYSGGSAAQLAYHRAGAERLMRRYAGKMASHLTVEIGCNDGSLLQHLHAANFGTLGVDPSEPAVEAARAGLRVLRTPFTSEVAREIVDAHGRSNIVIAYNVLAHVADLSDVLNGIYELIAPAGRAEVEVQYLPDLLAGNMIDQVYHEHRYHWSLSAFRRAARLHHLHVVDAELIELQGGGLRVTLSASMDDTPRSRVAAICDRERWTETPEAWRGMQGRVERVRDHLVALVDMEVEAGRPVVGYAAAAKATTILNYAGLGPARLKAVLDTTPYKQGRYVPGVRVPIWDPEVLGQPGHTRVLLAPNYLPHLLRTEVEFLALGGRWIVPLPTPFVI